VIRNEPCFFNLQLSIDLALAKWGEKCQPGVRKLGLLLGIIQSARLISYLCSGQLVQSSGFLSMLCRALGVLRVALGTTRGWGREVRVPSSQPRPNSHQAALFVPVRVLGFWVNCNWAMTFDVGRMFGSHGFCSGCQPWDSRDIWAVRLFSNEFSII
jgi:hypothetical protein